MHSMVKGPMQARQFFVLLSEQLVIESHEMSFYLMLLFRSAARNGSFFKVVLGGEEVIKTMD